MKKILLLTIVATLIIACKGFKGENDKGHLNSEQKIKIETVIGFVKLNDGDSGIFKSDFSGVKVEIKNSTSTLTSTTDRNGMYTLKNVPTGSYNLTFTKDGYWSKKSSNFNCNDSTSCPEEQLLNTKVLVKINKDAKIKYFKDHVVINGTYKTSSLKGQGAIVLLISEDKTIPISKWKNISFRSFKSKSPMNYNFNIYFKSFKSKTSIYTIISGIIGDPYMYLDKKLDKYIYPNLSESNSGIIEVKIP